MSSTVTAMVTLTAVIATMLEPSTQHSETLTVLYVHTTVLSPLAGWTTKSVLTDEPSAFHLRPEVAGTGLSYTSPDS